MKIKKDKGDTHFTEEEITEVLENFTGMLLTTDAKAQLQIVVDLFKLIEVSGIITNSSGAVSIISDSFQKAYLIDICKGELLKHDMELENNARFELAKSMHNKETYNVNYIN